MSQGRICQFFSGANIVPVVQVAKFSFIPEQLGVSTPAGTCERWYHDLADYPHCPRQFKADRAKFAGSVITNARLLPDDFAEKCWTILQEQLLGERFWRMTLRVLRADAFAGIGPHVDLNLYGPCLCALFYHCMGDVQTYKLELLSSSKGREEVSVSVGEGYIMWSHHTSQWMHRIVTEGDMEERGVVIMGFATETHHPHAFETLYDRWAPQWYHWRRIGQKGKIVAHNPTSTPIRDTITLSSEEVSEDEEATEDEATSATSDQAAQLLGGLRVTRASSRLTEQLQPMMVAQHPIVDATGEGPAKYGEYLGFVKVNWDPLIPFFRSNQDWPVMNTTRFNEKRVFATTLFGEVWSPVKTALEQDISEKLGQKYVIYPDPVFRKEGDTTEVKRNVKAGHIHVDGAAPKGVKSVILYATEGPPTWIGSRVNPDMHELIDQFENKKLTAAQVCETFMALKAADAKLRRNKKNLHGLPARMKPGNYIVFDQNARLHATEAADEAGHARSV